MELVPFEDNNLSFHQTASLPLYQGFTSMCFNQFGSISYFLPFFLIDDAGILYTAVLAYWATKALYEVWLFFCF